MATPTLEELERMRRRNEAVLRANENLQFRARAMGLDVPETLTEGISRGGAEALADPATRNARDLLAAEIQRRSGKQVLARPQFEPLETTVARATRTAGVTGREPTPMTGVPGLGVPTNPAAIAGSIRPFIAEQTSRRQQAQRALADGPGPAVERAAARQSEMENIRRRIMEAELMGRERDLGRVSENEILEQLRGEQVDTLTGAQTEQARIGADAQRDVARTQGGAQRFTAGAGAVGAIGAAGAEAIGRYMSSRAEGRSLENVARLDQQAAGGSAQEELARMDVTTAREQQVTPLIESTRDLIRDVAGRGIFDIREADRVNELAPSIEATLAAAAAASPQALAAAKTQILSQLNWGLGAGSRGPTPASYRQELERLIQFVSQFGQQAE